MVPKLKAILKVLEEIAPSRAAQDWDNPGLQVGHLSQDVEKILTKGKGKWVKAEALLERLAREMTGGDEEGKEPADQCLFA